MTDLETIHNTRIDELYAEVERLQRIIDSRPAINDGLPETYIKWSRDVFLMEATRAMKGVN